MAELIIRAVRPEDFEQWLPLWDGYNAFYGRSGPTALPPENTRVTWQRFFDGGEPVHALVAEQDGRLLGLVHYLYHRTTTTIDLVCYLNDLFTSADARGKGRRARPHPGGLRRGASSRQPPRLLADPRDECHGPAALRPDRREHGPPLLPQATVTAAACRRRRFN